MATVTADQMKTQKLDTNELQSSLAKRQQENQNYINSSMDNATNAGVQSIKDAGAKNEAAQAQVQTLGNQAYDFAKSDLNSQYNRTQRGMDSFADVRGLNRQEGSQQALQLGRANATATGGISASQGRAAEEWARQQQLIKDDTANRIKEAIANGDYMKAAATLDNYNNGNTWLDNRSAMLASLGSPAGIGIYGDDTVNFMQKLEAAQNPEVAYNTGRITAAEYERMTGKKPPNYVSNGSGGYGADYYINGRPVWTQEHGGLGYSVSGTPALAVDVESNAGSGIDFIKT